MDLSFSSWNVFTLQYESLFSWAHLICVWNIDLVDKGQGSKSMCVGGRCVCACLCVRVLFVLGRECIDLHRMQWHDSFISFFFFLWSREIWLRDCPFSLKILLIISAFEKQTPLWHWKRLSVFSMAFSMESAIRNDLWRPTNARKS